jgi:hypothetical protein
VCVQCQWQGPNKGLTKGCRAIIIVLKYSHYLHIFIIIFIFSYGQSPTASSTVHQGCFADSVRMRSFRSSSPSRIIPIDFNTLLCQLISGHVQLCAACFLGCEEQLAAWLPKRRQSEEAVAANRVPSRNVNCGPRTLNNNLKVGCLHPVACEDGHTTETCSIYRINNYSKQCCVRRKL